MFSLNSKKNLILLMIAVATILAGTLGLAQKADAGYANSGTMISTDLTSGLSVTGLDSFVASSSVPANTSLKIQFANSNSGPWYDASGNLNASSTLSDGTTTLNLSGLGWSSPLHYKVTLSTDNTNETPVFNNPTLYYYTGDPVERKALTVQADGSVQVGDANKSTGLSVYGTTSLTGNLSLTQSVTSGSWEGSSIAEPYGGTGITSYSPGDLLYGTGTSTLAKLNLGSTSTVLTSTGAQPSFSKLASSSIQNDTLDWAQFSDSMTLDASTSIDMSSSSADLTFGSNIFHIDSAGKVGIGTTTPATALEVIGTTTTAGNILPATDTSYALGSSANRWANLHTATATIGNTITIDSDSIDSSTTTTWNLADSATSSLSIESGLLNFDTKHSRLGIGTSSPATDLHVAGTSTISNALGIGTTTPSSKLTVASGNSLLTNRNNPQLTLGYGTATTTNFKVNAQGDFSIDDSRFMIDGTSGNIGIGTTSPDSALEVVGTTTFGGVSYSWPSSLGSTGDALSIDNASGQLIWSQVEASDDDWFIDATNSLMYATSGVDYVGIGTTSPDSLLHVGSAAGFQINDSGQVTSGTWQADKIGAQYGGTGWDSSAATGTAFVAGGSWSATSSLADPYVANNLTIDGGTINNTPIGQSDTAAAKFTTATTTDLFVSSLTSGSVPFVGTNGKLIEDNSNFYWDSGNARLGIGTDAPGTSLEVAGTTTARNILPASDSTYSLGSNATRWQDLYVASSSLHIGNSTAQGTIGYGVSAGALQFDAGSDGTDNMTINSNSVLGVGHDIEIGTASSSDDDYMYWDAGSEHMMWNDSETRFELSNDLKVSGSGTTTLANLSGDIVLDPAGGNVVPGGDAEDVLGTTSARWANIYSATATIGNTITIGSDSIDSSTTTTWNLADSATSSLNVEGGLLNFDTKHSRLGIGTSSPATALHIIGTSTASAHVTGDIKFANDWKITEGNRIGIATDTLAFQSPGVGSDLLFNFENSTSTTSELKVAGNLMPASDNTYDIGSTSTRWANLYAKNVNASDLGFANQFAITERFNTVSHSTSSISSTSSTSSLASDSTSSTSSSSSALVFQNQEGESIMSIDEEGNLILSGKLIENASTASSTATTSTTTLAGLMENTTSSDYSLYSTTSTTTASTTGVLARAREISGKVVDLLSSSKEYFVAKVTDALRFVGVYITDFGHLVTKRFTTNTARVQRMEMVDQETGEVYCSWIEGGEWQKKKGECEDIKDDEKRQTYYFDGDGDGFGKSGETKTATSAPENYVAKSGDCNDTDASINPEAEEVCGDNIDNDCDGNVDENCETTEASVELSSSPSSAESGEDVVFEANPSNFDTNGLSYQWLQNGSTLKNSSSNTFTKSFTLEGTYQMQVEATADGQSAIDFLDFVVENTTTIE